VSILQSLKVFFHFPDFTGAYGRSNLLCMTRPLSTTTPLQDTSHDYNLNLLIYMLGFIYRWRFILKHIRSVIRSEWAPVCLPFYTSLYLWRWTYCNFIKSIMKENSERMQRVFYFWVTFTTITQKRTLELCQCVLWY